MGLSFAVLKRLRPCFYTWLFGLLFVIPAETTSWAKGPSESHAKTSQPEAVEKLKKNNDIEKILAENMRVFFLNCPELDPLNQVEKKLEALEHPERILQKYKKEYSEVKEAYKIFLSEKFKQFKQRQAILKNHRHSLPNGITPGDNKKSYLNDVLDTESQIVLWRALLDHQPNLAEIPQENWDFESLSTSFKVTSKEIEQKYFKNQGKLEEAEKAHVSNILALNTYKKLKEIMEDLNSEFTFLDYPLTFLPGYNAVKPKGLNQNNNIESRLDEAEKLLNWMSRKETQLSWKNALVNSKTAEALPRTYRNKTGNWYKDFESDFQARVTDKLKGLTDSVTRLKNEYSKRNQELWEGPSLVGDSKENQRIKLVLEQSDFTLGDDLLRSLEKNFKKPIASWPNSPELSGRFGLNANFYKPYYGQEVLLNFDKNAISYGEASESFRAMLTSLYRQSPSEPLSLYEIKELETKATLQTEKNSENLFNKFQEFLNKMGFGGVLNKPGWNFFLEKMLENIGLFLESQPRAKSLFCESKTNELTQMIARHNAQVEPCNRVLAENPEHFLYALNCEGPEIEVTGTLPFHLPSLYTDRKNEGKSALAKRTKINAGAQLEQDVYYDTTLMKKIDEDLKNVRKEILPPEIYNQMSQSQIYSSPTDFLYGDEDFDLISVVKMFQNLDLDGDGHLTDYDKLISTYLSQ
jgi:hypothetical protein